MSKIIVAVDESQGSRDAIALFEAHLRQDSRELLDRLRSAQSDETVEVKAIANPSPSHGLHELAEHEHAALIVLGSTHRGRVGRVLPGSTADRLLHGAPCPVAVAPNGYVERSRETPAVVGCGYDGSPSARHALKAARRIAAATGARLRIISAFEPLAYDLPPGSISMGGWRPTTTRCTSAPPPSSTRRLRASRASPGSTRSSRSAIRCASSPRRPRRSTCWSSARAATARCTPSSAAACPDAS